MSNLAIIAPNFRSFIRSQVVSLQPCFKSVSVIIPKPYLTELIWNNRYLHDKFLFLGNIIDANEDARSKSDNGINMLFPRYLALPIEQMRIQSYYSAMHSSINVLMKSHSKFDLIHAHRMDLCGFTGAHLKDIINKPLVLTTHGSDTYDLPFRNKYYRKLTEFMLEKADHVIAVSKTDGANLLSLGLSSDKLSIIPNGFNGDIFKPYPKGESRQKLNLPQDKKILLCVATLHRVKGHAHLLEAMHNLSHFHKDLLLILVGSGPLEHDIMRKIHELKLKNVIFIGWKKHEEIPLWMNAADFLVLPSFNEGLPIVIPEAMACGKPIIASNVGGIPDIISNEELGTLVNPGDSDALAIAIMNAIDKKWNEELIIAYAQKYSMGCITKQIRQIYRKVGN